MNQLNLWNIDSNNKAGILSGVTFIPKDESLGFKTETALEAIYAIFSAHKIVSVSFSGGKDSSVLMHLVCKAAVRARDAGLSPFVSVMSSDTGVENPEISGLLRSEQAKIRAFLEQHGIAHSVETAKPSLATSWATRVLGGNKLPSFPGQSRDCSVQLKIAPMRSARAALFRDWGKENVVLLIGTRFDESSERAAAMKARGEQAVTPYVNAEGELTLSPLAFWVSEDIWETLGYIRAGVDPSYSDLEDTFRVYASAGGTSCAVVSDMVLETTRKARGSCSARFGCATCLVVKQDQSLSTMMGAGEEYRYMQGLSDFRDFIANNHWDMSKRQHVGRSIDDFGRVNLQPDCYSPAYLLELYRYALTLDVQEQEAARKLKIAPRFELVGLETMVAIDALWSLNGFHPPHTALLEWLQIHERGVRYPVPHMAAEEVIPRMPMPAPEKLHVGMQWDGEGHAVLGGLLSVGISLAECESTNNAADGRVLPEVQNGQVMHVDLESLAMALDFEFDAILERNSEPASTSDWTSGYRFWISYGTLTLGRTQVAEHDLILRRTHWRARSGLHGEAGNISAQTSSADARVKTLSLFD